MMLIFKTWCRGKTGLELSQGKEIPTSRDWDLAWLKHWIVSILEIYCVSDRNSIVWTRMPCPMAHISKKLEPEPRARNTTRMSTSAITTELNDSPISDNCYDYSHLQRFSSSLLLIPAKLLECYPPLPPTGGKDCAFYKTMWWHILGDIPWERSFIWHKLS